MVAHFVVDNSPCAPEFAQSIEVAERSNVGIGRVVAVDLGEFLRTGQDGL